MRVFKIYTFLKDILSCRWLNTLDYNQFGQKLKEYYGKNIKSITNVDSVNFIDTMIKKVIFKATNALIERDNYQYIESILHNKTPQWRLIQIRWWNTTSPAVTPLLTRRSYCSFALSIRHHRLHVLVSTRLVLSSQDLQILVTVNLLSHVKEMNPGLLWNKMSSIAITSVYHAGFNTNIIGGELLS